MPRFDVNSVINYSLKELSMGVSGRLPHQYGGIEPSIKNAWENPGIRFGDRTKGTSRPRSREGKISFHFAQTSISKSSEILEMINAAKKGKPYVSSQAVSHAFYIERERAVERLEPTVDHQSYIERPGAAERTEQEIKDSYDPRVLGPALTRSSFGTIGRTIEERAAFWRAVEECERDRHGDQIKIDPSRNPEWWSAAQRDTGNAPPALQQHLRKGALQKIHLKKLDTNVAFAIYQWAVGLSSDAPIEVIPGRGGRTQTRIIAELPHELTSEQRLEIVRRFTRTLEEKSFPFWAVVHAPDKNNDARNYHVHIDYYDRPAVRMRHPMTGQEVWDFSVIEIKRDKHRNRWESRPYRQNRDRETNRKDWVAKLRRRWSDACNEVLAEAGADKRLDPRSYKDMGIDLKPLKHIPSRAFNKERKGELTEEGVNLARRQWLVLQQSVEIKAPMKLAKLEADIIKRTERAKRAALKAGVVMPAYNKALEIQALKATRTAQLLARSEFMRAIFCHVVDRVASRAKLQLHEWERKSKLKRSKRRPPPKAMTAVRDFLMNVYRTGLQINRIMTQDITVIGQHLKAYLDGFDRLAKQPPKTAIEASRVTADITKKPERLALTADPYWHGRSERVQRLVNRLDEHFDQFIANYLRQRTHQETAPSVDAPAPTQPKPTKAPRPVFLSTFMEEQEAARKARRAIRIPPTVRKPSQIAKPVSQASPPRPSVPSDSTDPAARATSSARPAHQQVSTSHPSSPTSPRPADRIDPVVALGAKRAGTQVKIDTSLAGIARHTAISGQQPKRPEDPKPAVQPDRPPEQAAVSIPIAPKKPLKKRKSQDRDRGR